jgi:glyoxylate reductase
MAPCFVTRPLPGGGLDRLAAEHEVDLWPHPLPPPPDALREHAAPAEGLLCLLTDRIDAGLIAACPHLRVISNFAVGCDNVDVPAVRARGIALGYTPDVLTETTADLAFTLMLAIARRLPEAMAAVRAGEWQPWDPSWMLASDLHGSTLGIVGLGRIGRAVARRAQGFDMEVLHTSRRSGVPLDDLLARADFVSLHCPLTPQTRHLIAAPQLRAMKPTAYLVNTARGGVVDQAALETALRQGWIAGAALDVTEPEPLGSDHPLLDAPNLIVLPHLGSATRATRERMADLAVDNLLAGLAGRTLPSEFPAP